MDPIRMPDGNDLIGFAAIMVLIGIVLGLLGGGAVIWLVMR